MRKLSKLLTCFLLIMLVTVLSVQMLYAQLSVTLTPSNYNGYDISCFGAQDGSITANVTGGTPPYTYQWSVDWGVTATVTGLAAGYYNVRVQDANGADSEVEAEITLREPEAIALQAIPYVYPNEQNISCYSCSNGIIDLYVDNGTAPYSFLWVDGNTNQNRTALSPGTYAVTVTDANGCISVNEGIYLTEPERDDWTMNGNTNTNPSSQFIGTTDNKDLVFKTNNTELLRMKANGDLNLNGLTGTADRLLYVDANGNLKANPGTVGVLSSSVPWMTRGNDNICWQCPTTADDFIGTLNSAPFVMKTNSEVRMIVEAAGNVAIQKDLTVFADGVYSLYTNNGTVGIGTNYIPASHALAVKGNIIAEKVTVQLFANWPDYVFNSKYKLMTIEELDKFVSLYNHLPNIPSAKEIEEKGLDLGGVQIKQMEKIEEMALYIIELNKKIEAQNKRIAELEKNSKK